jgi:hypothetical protein
MLGYDFGSRCPRCAIMRSESQATQAEKVFCACFAPEHPGLLESAADDAFASRFDDPAADEVAFCAELAITGAVGLILEVGDFAINFLDFF